MFALQLYHTRSLEVREFSSMDTTRTKSPRIQSRFKLNVLQILSLAVTKLATQRYVSNFCIEFGGSITLGEANAPRSIAKHTSTPVPKVHHAFTHHGRTCILMEGIRGESVTFRQSYSSESPHF
jgi:hypothetical protein